MFTHVKRPISRVFHEKMKPKWRKSHRKGGKQRLRDWRSFWRRPHCELHQLQVHALLQVRFQVHSQAHSQARSQVQGRRKYRRPLCPDHLLRPGLCSPGCPWKGNKRTNRYYLNFHLTCGKIILKISSSISSWKKPRSVMQLGSQNSRLTNTVPFWKTELVFYGMFIFYSINRKRNFDDYLEKCELPPSNVSGDVPFLLIHHLSKCPRDYWQK